MIIASLLIHQFEFNQLLITRGLDDVSHAESLVFPKLEGNCINWIVGHIITSRSNLEAMLGASSYWSRKQCEPYIPNKPFDSEHALLLGELKSATVDSLSHLIGTLKSFELQTSDFSDSSGRAKAEEIATFVCHEAYHAGQIHMIRRTLGKPGLFG